MTETEKIHRERINKVLTYINNNLSESLDLEKLANQSSFSQFHFHRIMKAYLNESLMSYIIRLRLEMAARLILFSNDSVMDVAYKVGYDAPSSFNKAFKKQFGIAPNEFRQNGKVSIIHFKSQNNMEKLKFDPTPKMKELKPKKVIFVQSIGSYSQGSGIAWDKVCTFAKNKRLFGWKTEFIGISHDDPNITEQDKLRYDACVTISKDIKPEGEVGVKEIAGGKYAVFLYKGPYEGFEQVYNTIFNEWYPKSGLELREIHCFEKYLNSPEKTKPENLKTEIYIPVK